VSQQSESVNSWELKGLPAFAPDKGLQEKLMLFGQFVGDWDIVENRYVESDGREIFQKGKLYWRWTLDGRAVQDVWLTLDEATGAMIPDGTTVRFYNPKIDAWNSVWLSPLQGVVKQFIGRKIGDDIVLEGQKSGAFQAKWIFSEIERNSFRWHSEETNDDGKTWKLREEMRIRRI
jgi:hypothetical protein